MRRDLSKDFPHRFDDHFKRGLRVCEKQPKYEQARALTPEQAALVRRSIAQEKVLIKDIKMRTPLVETYIQDTRPDEKLYEVPVDDQYT